MVKTGKKGQLPERSLKKRVACLLLLLELSGPDTRHKEVRQSLHIIRLGLGSNLIHLNYGII